MIENTKHLNVVQEIFNTANTILGYDVLGKCGLNVDPENLKDTKYAQPLMFIAGLAHAELMKEKHPAIFSKVKAVAGFSLGEVRISSVNIFLLMMHDIIMAYRNFHHYSFR